MAKNFPLHHCSETCAANHWQLAVFLSASLSAVVRRFKPPHLLLIPSCWLGMRENVLFSAGWAKTTVLAGNGVMLLRSKTCYFPPASCSKGPLRQCCSQLYLPGVGADCSQSPPSQCQSCCKEDAALKIFLARVQRVEAIPYSGGCCSWSKHRAPKMEQYLFYR